MQPMIQMKTEKDEGEIVSFTTLVSQQNEKSSQTFDKAHVSHVLSVIDEKKRKRRWKVEGKHLY